MLSQNGEKLEVPAHATNLAISFLRHHPSAIAALHKVQEEWKSETWGTIVQRVGALSEGLVALEVKSGNRVSI